MNTDLLYPVILLKNMECVIEALQIIRSEYPKSEIRYLIFLVEYVKIANEKIFCRSELFHYNLSKFVQHLSQGLNLYLKKKK